MIFLREGFEFIRINKDIGFLKEKKNVRLAGRKENGLWVGRRLPCDKEGRRGTQKIDEYNEGGLVVR